MAAVYPGLLRHSTHGPRGNADDRSYGTTLLAVSLSVLGVLVAGISNRFRLPASAIVLLMILGSDVLGGVYVDGAALVHDLSVIALAIVFFESRLHTKLSALPCAGLTDSRSPRWGTPFSGVTE